MSVSTGLVQQAIPLSPPENNSAKLQTKAQKNKSNVMWDYYNAVQALFHLSLLLILQIWS